MNPELLTEFISWITKLNTLTHQHRKLTLTFQGMDRTDPGYVHAEDSIAIVQTRIDDLKLKIQSLYHAVF
jgi:hypothetical protein